ncbi:MAG: arginase [Candidatus Paceibacterota bacterium]|jgi:arginase
MTSEENSLGLYKKTPVKETVSVIGIPFEEGSGAEGLKDAPAYLRELGILGALNKAGINANDSGDAVFDPSQNKDKTTLKNTAIAMAESVANKVAGEIKAGNKVLALGGDHAISLGTIAGASRACDGDLLVIWIDAHPDLCTWEESITKNIHGMQAAALLGIGDAELVNTAGTGAKIKKENLFYIGLKDMDDYEIRFLLEQGIKTITMYDIEKNGMSVVLSKVEEFLKSHKNIWVSLDMDGIQKQYVPSSPMATDEGLTAREVLALTRLIGRKGNVLGADIVELSANNDPENKTGLLAIDLSAKLFGSDFGWYERYMNQHD